MKPTRFCLSLLLLLPALASAETLVYEREFSMIAEEDNTLRIELAPDGRLVVERPLFMTRAGRYELQVDPAEYSRLRAAFETAYTDTDALHADVQRRASNEEIVVTDPEYSRFALVDEQRGPLQQVAAVSLAAWTSVFDDPRLERLEALESEWFSLMNAQLAEVSE